MWTIGYDDTDGDLHLALQVKNGYQKSGIATGVWKWTVEHLFPQMLLKKVQVNQKPLDEAYIRAITHPDHLAKVLEKAGFTKVARENHIGDGFTYIEKSYVGAFNDGQRVLYEIPLKKAIPSNL